VEVWEAATIFIVVALVVGTPVYFVVFRTEQLQGAWETYKERSAERRAQADALEAARRREREFGIELALLPATVLDRVVEEMVRTGHSLEHRTNDSASFVREEGADSCLGCLLMLFFLLPGLLYLLLARSTKRTSVVAYSLQVGGSAGTRLVIGGDDYATVNGLAVWARNLASGPAEKIEIGAVETRTEDRLRELERLRESGLVSDDEYRAKRDQILKEM